jgi:cell division protein FtsW (lipid II flippase)
MRLPFRTTEDRDSLEPAPSPVLPLSCLLAIVVALVVVDVRLGSRLALIAAVFAAVSLATRLPRVIPVTAVLCLALAGIAVLAASGRAPVTAAYAAMRAKPRTHAVRHARTRRHPGTHAAPGK